MGNAWLPSGNVGGNVVRCLGRDDQCLKNIHEGHHVACDLLLLLLRPYESFGILPHVDVLVYDLMNMYSVIVVYGAKQLCGIDVIDSGVGRCWS